MKRFTRVLVIFFTTLILVVLIFPTFFKDKIKQAILDAFAQNVNAELFFADVNLSLIPNFPDFTLSIAEMGIIGVEIFEGDTLLSAQEASITINALDVISGKEIGAKSITLTSPSIVILTLADGSANYDITKISKEEQTAEVEASTEVSFGINHFEILEGEFIYFDQSTEVFLQLEDINVSGDGNFENDIFDLVTTGALNFYDFNYAGIDYLEDKEVELDVTLGMDLINSTYTFKQNQFLINTFPLQADGSFGLLEEGYTMDLEFNAPEATFSQLLSLVPGIYRSSMDNLEAKGTLDFQGALSGVYSEKSMPSFNFGLNVANGAFAYENYPERIEEFNLGLQIANPSGRLEETSIEVAPLSFRVGDSPFEAKLFLSNLSNYKWDLEAKGDLDLTLVNTLYPQDGVLLEGILSSNVKSSGDYTLVEKEAYDELPFEGDLKIQSLVYNDLEYLSVSIDQADLTFNNNDIVLSNMSGKTKSTTFQADGKVSNFIGFALSDEVLKGEFKGRANELNINEWMTSSDPSTDEVEEESDYGLIRIPENIDFNASITVNQINYNDLNFKNAKGRLDISNGIVSFNDSGMDLFNGSLGINGSYNSAVEKPFFDFGLDLDNISIPQSFQSVSLIQSYAPVAQNMTGLFNTNFRISGELGEDLMPDLATLSGVGLIEVLEASLGNSELLSGLSGVTKLADIASATLEKVKMQAEIKDGRLFVKPFDLKLGDYESQIFGSTGIDGSVDYNINMNIPSGKVGNQLNTIVSDLVGSQQNLVGQNLVMTIGMTGTFTQPKFGVKSVQSEKGETFNEQVTNTIKAEVKAKSDSVKQVADDKVNQVKDSATVFVESKKDSITVLADSLISAKKDTISTLAANKLGLQKDSVDAQLKNVKDKAKGALKGLLKKKKKKKDN